MSPSLACNTPRLFFSARGIHCIAEIPFMEEDREIRPDIEQVEKLVRSDELQDAVRKIVPDFD